MLSMLKAALALSLAVFMWGCDSKVQFSNTGKITKAERPGDPDNPDIPNEPEQPPVEQPPIEQPPVEEPQPPSEEPPVEEPPVEEPPAEEPQPPVEEPPVEEPPVEEPEPPREEPEPPREEPPGNEQVSESFHQEVEQGKVDILFVIDNSLSMRENQKKLAGRFSSFVSDLSDVDWQVAFTTVDSYSNTTEPGRHGKIDLLDGADGKVMNSDTANVNQVFAESVVRDRLSQCSGDGSSQWNSRRRRRSGRIGCVTRNEEPMKSLVKSVYERNDANADFFRDGAEFVAVVVSDEDERSTGKSKHATRPEKVIQAVQQAWDGEKSFTGYGIIVQPGDKGCLKKNRKKDVSYYGTFVAKLAKLTGGITGSICDGDYGPTMKAIGKNVKRTLLHQQFELLHMPVAGTVKVELVPTADIDWTLRDNVLIFAEKPPEGTEIKVTYEVAPAQTYAAGN